MTFLKEFFLFNTMLFPKVVTVLYWLVLVSIFISGIGQMFSDYGGGFWVGLLSILGGWLVARIVFEMIMVIFKINDNLKKIADRS
jgi:TM2 domain-containing membrane protein YozV